MVRKHFFCSVSHSGALMRCYCIRSGPRNETHPTLGEINGHPSNVEHISSWSAFCVHVRLRVCVCVRTSIRVLVGVRACRGGWVWVREQRVS